MKNQCLLGYTEDGGFGIQPIFVQALTLSCLRQINYLEEHL